MNRLKLYTIKILNQDKNKLGKYDYKMFKTRREMKRWIKSNQDLFVAYEWE